MENFDVKKYLENYFKIEKPRNFIIKTYEEYDKENISYNKALKEETIKFIEECKRRKHFKK